MRKCSHSWKPCGLRKAQSLLETLLLFPKHLHFLSEESKLTKYRCLHQAFPPSSLWGRGALEFVAHPSVSWRNSHRKMTPPASHSCTQRLSYVPSCSGTTAGLGTAQVRTLLLSSSMDGVPWACPCSLKYSCDTHPLPCPSSRRIPPGRLSAALLPHQVSSSGRKEL